jgi:negative regulator of sigma-B (phosphoserine phosphatase)
MKIATALMSRPKVGEIESGDVAVIRRADPNGERVLFAVIDALGHGRGAATVAAAAQRSLMSTPFAGDDVVCFLMAIDRALKGTRGAAGLVCLFTGDSFVAAAVGNVELAASARTVGVRSVAGVLGSLRREPRALSSAARAGDRIAIFSDGVSQRFSLSDTTGLSTDQACRTIFAAHARDHDDATLLLIEVTQ